MKSKPLFLTLVVFFIIPLIQAQGNITNIMINQPLSNITAGETTSTTLTFYYPDISPTYPYQQPNAPLVLIINITSENQDYPVWKNDFTINGTMNSINNFTCTQDNLAIDYPFNPITLTNIPNQTFYCTDNDFLSMNLNSINEIKLDIKSHLALYPGKYNFSLGFFYPENLSSSFNFIIFSPFAQNYDSKRIFFNLTIDRQVQRLSFINYNDKRPRWKRLCQDCNEYGYLTKKLKSLNEGWNNLTIQANDYLENITKIDINLFIDSKKPRIFKTLPRRNNYVNGSFYIQYTEENLRDIELLFGNKTKFITTSDGCLPGEKKECTFKANLTQYEGEYIYYWFNVSDIVRAVESRKVKFWVDTISPTMNVSSPQINSTQDKKVLFNLTIEEENFDKVEYIDYNTKNPQWKTICTILKDNSCYKAKSFKSGIHNLSIRAIDKAGNSDIKNLEFEVL